MEVPLGSETLNEYIKEYLGFNEFKNTYDCFVAELKARKVSSKLLNKPQAGEKPENPRIYEFLKNDKEKTNKENQLEAQLFALNQAYKQTLLAARSILSVSVGIIDYLHNNSEKLKTSLKDYEERIESYKQSLTKYHSILTTQPPKNEELSIEKIRKAKEDIFQGIEKERGRKITEALLGIRIALLKGKVEQRGEAIKSLLEEDVFRFREQDNFESIYKLIDLNDHVLTTSLLALVSMLASCEDGVSYLTAKFSKPDFLLRVFKILKEEVPNSTLKRFALAILEKSSVSPEVLDTLLQNEILTWLLVTLNTIDAEDTFNAFFANYASALLLNAVTFMINRGKDLKDLVPGGSEFIISLCLKLLYLEKMGFVAIYNNLLTLGHFFTKAFLGQLHLLSFPKKMKEFQLKLQTRANLNEQQKKILEVLGQKLFSISNADDNLELLLSQKAEYRREVLQTEIQRNSNAPSIIFEVFTDEIY